MAISPGGRIPDVKLMTMTDDGPQPVQSADVLGSGTVVLFGVPGAFTPTCSDHHLPGFVLRSGDLADKGVDKVACISVNDAFVMGAWGDANDAGGKVDMLADGNGEFAAAIGLEMDGTGFGMGIRSRRYAMIIDDGVIRDVFVEDGGGLDVSSAESILAKL
jgi:glutaredoxin/glutathione-dependent peroxiredoxin